MATIQGYWREHHWGIEGETVNALYTITKSRQIKQNQQNDIAGGSSGNNVGFEPFSVSFNWEISANAGISDINEYIKNWEADLGSFDYLVIGENYLYEKMLQLVAFSASEIGLSLDGKFLKATLNATFTEKTAEETEKRTTKQSKNRPKRLTDKQRQAIREQQGRTGAGVGPSQATKNAELSKK